MGNYIQKVSFSPYFFHQISWLKILLFEQNFDFCPHLDLWSLWLQNWNAGWKKNNNFQIFLTNLQVSYKFPEPFMIFHDFSRFLTLHIITYVLVTNIIYNLHITSLSPKTPCLTPRGRDRDIYFCHFATVKCRNNLAEKRRLYYMML